MVDDVQKLKIFLKSIKNPKSVAFMSVDAQRDFCAVSPSSLGSDITDDIALDIANVVRDFNTNSVSTIGVYHDNDIPKSFQDRFKYDVASIRRPFDSKGGFYAVKPNEFTLIHSKRTMNAFDDEGEEINGCQTLKERLNGLGITHIFAAGFYTANCLRRTVESGIVDFEIAVMEDLTGNPSDEADGYDKEGIQEMERAGAIITDSVIVRQAMQNNFKQ